MKKLFIEDLNMDGKSVIVRVDYNVPLKDGEVDNDKRIRASLPTVKYLIAKNAKIILMSHLGRPDGVVVESLRMRPVAAALGRLLGKEVKYVQECIGENVKKEAASLKPGEILLLENLRFYPGEEGDDPAFAENLAQFAEIYINDAFGTAHRSHASTAGITKFVKQSACGYLMKKEMDYLHDKIQNPQKPFIAIIGGSKVSSKIGVIESLLKQVDQLLLGGAMTHTFLKAKGSEIGKSVFEPDRVDLAGNLLAKFEGKISLPTDYVVSDSFDLKARQTGELRTVSASGISSTDIALDIGPETQKRYAEIISRAKTVLWNGPVGVSEIPGTAKGTIHIAHAMAAATENSAITVVGGGDSVSAVEKAGLGSKMSHISTGGGASLEFLENGTLPGVEALSDHI